MVTVTIDNKTFEVEEGTTVLNAARQAGIEIPTLCDHPHLTPFGGCRLCVVDIDGFRTLQSACTIPVSNNMVVRTDTNKVRDARKFVLTLIFSERNHFCPYCQVGDGDCELQNSAYKEGMTHWPLQPNWQPFPVDASHPYFVLEHNRCILCRRCIRACSELVGANTLNVQERGSNTFVIADLNVPLGKSTCVSCGSCVQVCPTGAMIDRRSAYRGPNTTLDHHKTICLQCSLGCGIDVLTRDEQIVRIEGDFDAQINQGVICKAGRFLPLEEDRERITKPLVRENGTLKPTSWEEALVLVAHRLKSLLEQEGKSVAAIASDRLPAEALYRFKQIFKDGFKSDTVTSLDEGRSTNLSYELTNAIGKSFESDLESLQDAGSYLVFGVDLIDKHEVAGFFIRRTLQNGKRLIVVDANKNDLNAFANCTVTPKANSELAFLKGLSAAVVKLGLNKTGYSENASEVLVEEAKKSGISTDLLLEAAFNFAGAENPTIIYDTIGVKDISTLQAMYDLAVLTGAKLVNPKGSANCMSAAQFGLDQPFSFNGHKAAYVALGDDQPSEHLVNTLEKSPFLVVQASYASRLTAQADVVFPVEQWLEQEGHYLSADGRLQAAHKSITAPENVWSNLAVLTKIANLLNIIVDDHWNNEIVKRVSPVEITA
jgi:formate dehydrogenase major subunit